MRVWPIIDLFDEIGTRAMRSPKTAMQPIDSILSFSGVEVPWALMVSMSPATGGRPDRRHDRAPSGSTATAVAAFARAEHIAEDPAPRAFARSASSRTRAAPPSPMKPSRFLENGFEAPSGGSFCVDSAERSEKRMSDSGVHETVGPDAQGSLRLAPRIASTPSWIAVAPDEQAVESEIGDPFVPKLSATRSATVPKMKRSCHALKARAGGLQEIVVRDGVVVRPGGFGQGFALRPFHLDGRDGDEEGAGSPSSRCPTAPTASAASTARRSTASAPRRVRP